MNKKVFIGLLISLTALAGFGATPSKPDFAFPKTVSTDAKARLKAAEKKNNGPEIVRALLDYSLAEVAVNPDQTAKVLDFMAEVEKRTDAPTTRAMIQLARAGFDNGGDSLAIDAICRYGSDLKLAPTREWRLVVNADELFFPTLYDFAIGSQPSLPDSIIDRVLEFDADRPYPLIYLELQRAHDYEALRRLYERFASEPAGLYPMLAMARAASTLSERAEAYELLAAIADPDDETRRAIDYLLRPQLETQSNSIVGLNDELKIKVSAICLNKATIAVEMLKPTPRTLKPIELTFSGKGVFQVDTVVSLRLDQYGEYRLSPRFDKLPAKSKSSSRVIVTDFLLSRAAFGRQKEPVMALDVLNGALQQNVTITPAGNNQLKGTRGKDAYSPAIYSGEGYEPSKRERRFANIVTDRAIYHPGDSLRFAATLMTVSGTRRALSEPMAVGVTLRNANYQPIDSLKLRSDDMGRINGTFAIPADGLTGYFTISVGDFASSSVMVADYKAPTFDVELRAERLDSTTVELTGSAIGYNGFPLADAQIALSVREMPVWVWFRNFRNAFGSTVATDTVSTDASGRFAARLSVPAGVNLSAGVTATSAAGESHDAQAFIPFFRYFIDGEAGQYVNAATPPRFTLRNAAGAAVDLPLKITLTAKGDTLVPDSAWSNIPSGAYDLNVEADGAHPSQFEICVYRQSDPMPPTESGLFIPRSSAAPGDKLLVGTSFADSHILMVKWTPDTILEQRWLEPQQGNFFIDITLPDSVDDATLTFLTLRNYRFIERIVSISRPDAPRSLTVAVESLRNKMIPGESERWTIRVDNNLGRAQQAAVMLNVYSRALDALRPLQWSFTPPPVWGRNLHFNNAPSYFDGTFNSLPYSFASPIAGTRPGFNLWGQSWPREEVMLFRSYGSSKMMMKAAATGAMAMNDMAADTAVAESAADSGEACLEESAVEVNGGAQSEPESDAYRLPEVPVALWQPELTTGADGSVEVTFTAPDANTTWGVKALAYNRNLLSGLFGADIIASKPIMVQPGLPRFMRQGDEIELKAMIQNATDSVATTVSTIEIFNPANDSIIARSEFFDTIAAQSSALVSRMFTAPASTAVVGVRVRATAGRFTDGEQSLIAILPSEMTVTTGTPLFLPSDSVEATVNVPRGGTLTFTANATWECVAALPALAAPESRSALTAANALFSVATARGLLRAHPEIARALHSWEAGDSMLVSRLMRNDDLKLALLSSTPFVNAAQSQTDQRARLLLLFNNRLIDKTINEAIATLSKLSRNGGLAWVEGNSEPSEWITLRVLSTIADLKRLGYLPDSKQLSRLTTNAVEYLDREVAKEYARNKKATFPAYVMVRSRFPEVRQSAPARRAAAATVQQLVGHWRDLPLASLAPAAIILNENGYQSTARRLLESLRQHEAWNQTPLDANLLNAFASIEPGCADVETIRNSYLRRKQSADWGRGADVSALVAAILNSGDTWLIPAANSLSVQVNGQPTDVAAERFTGEFRLDLPEGALVEISKGHYPAWGGVFSASVDSIANVEPFAGEELKLTRSISGTMAPGEKVTVTLTLEASQSIDYVLVTQPLCAAFEAVDQLPAMRWTGVTSVYREPLASCVNWYLTRLPKGKTILTETFYVTADGTFTLAPAQAQSQYAPQFQSHTAGQTL